MMMRIVGRSCFSTLNREKAQRKHPAGSATGLLGIPEMTGRAATPPKGSACKMSEQSAG
jgi:hypothetical protein